MLLRNPESVGRRCRGTFDLSHAVLNAPDNQTSFIITEITGRRHHLKAMSSDDKARWIQILSSVIEKSRSGAGLRFNLVYKFTLSTLIHFLRICVLSSIIFVGRPTNGY